MDHPGPGAAPALCVEGAEVVRGGSTILDEVSLTAAAGTVVAVLGTNGAGKSTLLRAVSGLWPLRRGTIRLHGTDITGWDPARRVAHGLAHVPGGLGVFPTMSVADNLAVGCHLFAWDRARVEERTRAVLDIFPALAPRSAQRAGSLSGGEQQMLALAKGLLGQPRVLLVDELTLGLAPLVVGQLLDVVRAQRQAGTAVVLVEQSLDVALAVADRAVWMEKGRIRFDGPAQELTERPDLVRAVLLGGRGPSPPPAGERRHLPPGKPPRPYVVGP